MTFSSVLCLLVLTAPALSAQTNVLVMMADDLGWNGVGFHSRAMTTPNLDRLAKEGVELQRFYSYPVCSPARAALLTGQMPRRFGISDVIGPGASSIPEETRTFPGVFKAAGYQTTLIGKWHLGGQPGPNRMGFDHFYGFLGPEIDYYKHTSLRGERIDWQRNGETVEEEGYSSDLFAEEAIRRIKQRDVRRPFFIDVAFNAPHFPIAAPEALIAKHEGNLEAAAIEAMDLAVGRILSTLDDLKLRESTLVVFLSDNGSPQRTNSNAPLKSGKGTVYEGGIRVPCVMRWPGKIAPGTKVQQAVANQDLFPTIAAAVGVKVPGSAKLDGTNQWPVLQTGKSMGREPFLIAARDTALFDGDWKLIEWSTGSLSLFNLRTDVGEEKDLYGKETEQAKRLTAMLDELKKGLPDVSEGRGPSGAKGKGKAKGKK